MTDTSFRRINIDLLDPDRVVPTDLYNPDPRTGDVALAETQAKETLVRSALQRGDVTAALETLLQGAPYGEAEYAPAKEASLQLVLLVLNSTKSTDIAGVVTALSPADQLTLCKYLYVGMQLVASGANDPQASNGNVLLSWHEKLAEVGGTGIVARVMTDRRRV